jgi:hypothetical protein
LALDAIQARGHSQHTVKRQSGRQWPGSVATRPKHVCNHPNRHEFYCWRSPDAAQYERDLMASNPHYARLYVSEVYAGTLGGWAWAVCWTCRRTEE